ncbi:MAG: hypothetical protein ACM3N7_04415, partial [Planctomycetaceae bacterium]
VIIKIPPPAEVVKNLGSVHYAFSSEEFHLQLHGPSPLVNKKILAPEFFRCQQGNAKNSGSLRRGIGHSDFWLFGKFVD